MSEFMIFLHEILTTPMLKQNTVYHEFMMFFLSYNSKVLIIATQNMKALINDSFCNECAK